jgi:hypothetical protein
MSISPLSFVGRLRGSNRYTNGHGRNIDIPTPTPGSILIGASGKQGVSQHSGRKCPSPTPASILIGTSDKQGVSQHSGRKCPTPTPVSILIGQFWVTVG